MLLLLIIYTLPNVYPCRISATGKQWWKMMQDLQSNPALLKSLTDFPLVHKNCFLKISAESVHNSIEIFFTEAVTETQLHWQK